MADYSLQKDFSELKVALLTSGGDSQGMNAALRSCSRMVLSLGGRVFSVLWGYQGLVDGGDNIKESFWPDFSKTIFLGGTVLGSARCADFMTFEGRKRACLNLILHGIDRLVVIGGDGSLTGASIFRTEWPDYIEQLLKEENIKKFQAEKCRHLTIVGLVGSIDNDFCGTDMTIGTDSALHRIIECVDSIITTAESHRRGFVVEIMGRHAGYLALSSGLSVGADFVFIPEFPPDVDWQDSLARTIEMFLKRGKKYAIVLVAEGAIDRSGTPISANEIKEVLCKRVGLDSRVTVLGHIQRGGHTSAYDRLLATRQGIEAAVNVLTATPSDPPYVICTKNIHIVRTPLSECIAMCNDVKACYKEHDIDRVVSLRGKSFIRSLERFKALQNLLPLSIEGPLTMKFKFAIVHIGAPSAGMDPCTRAFVIWCAANGHSVIGFRNGFEGVVQEDYIDLDWLTVHSWFKNAGSSLGASRFGVAGSLETINGVFKKLGINGLAIIGGFDGVFYLREFHEARKRYPGFRIPIIMVPATISNNVACTSYSLGTDTTLNAIAQCCDALLLSARSSRKRIFAVETFGKQCGCLATMSAVVSAADYAYSLQNAPTIYDFLTDIENFKEKFKLGYADFGMLTVSNNFSNNFTIDTLVQLLNEEGDPHFTARKAVIGYIQQGTTPSPFDRFLSAKFGTKIAQQMISFLEGDPEFLRDPSTCCMIASTLEGYCFFDFKHVIDQTDVKLRCPKESWWTPLRSVLKILSNSDYTYHSLTIPGAVFERARRTQPNK